MTWETIAQVSITLGGGAFLTILAYLGKEKVKSLEDKITAEASSRERMRLFLEEKIKAQDERMKHQEEQMLEFKDNYLDRFESVNKNIHECKEQIHDCKEQIIDKLHQLELNQKPK